jgi:Rad3-related DNA helicase
VSYELAYDIAKFVRKGRRNVFTYDDSRGRELALQQFKAAEESVLVAPSLDRGIDLPGDLCRVVGICKIPYGNLGDRQINGRLHRPGGRAWYNVQAISTIIQMSGRGVRNREDWCTTYILDKQFKRLYNQNRGLFPAWWKEALSWDK